jgi:hypothetical protein
MGKMLASLPFYDPNETFEELKPRWVLTPPGVNMTMRSLSDGGRAFESQMSPAEQKSAFQFKDRPNHPFDQLLIDSATEHGDPLPMRGNLFNPVTNSSNRYSRERATDLGYLSIPHCALHPLDQYQFGTDTPSAGQPEFGFTAEELMEEYMQTQTAPTVADVAVVEVIQIEDDRAHQLNAPGCMVAQAVTLLRLLEEDIYMLERVSITSVDDMIKFKKDQRISNEDYVRNSVRIKEAISKGIDMTPEVVWGNKLNALANMHHSKLIGVLRQLKTDDRGEELIAALDRMEYTNWTDADGCIHLRHKAHNQYGSIVI